MHKSLAARAVEISDKFLTKIIIDLRENERVICKQFEAIQERALQIPENFKEMADYMEFMTNLKEKELPNLASMLDDARIRLVYVVGLTMLTQEHIQQNNETFTWPQKILPLLEKAENILSAAQGKNQASLKERRMKFNQELDEFSRQVEELQDVGDLDEMSFYAKKVLSLQKQLQSAAETIAQFNKEEALYGWEVTAYPQRKQVQGALEPFQALYTTAVNFQKSYKKWMDGNLLDLDSENVEADVDNLKR